MISKEVQGLIDQVRQTKDIETASRDAIGFLVQQSGDLKSQVADLQAKLAGGGVSADDLAAIASLTQDLHSSAIEMQSAIPANVAPAGTDSGSTTGSTSTGSTDPGTSTTGAAPLIGDNSLKQDGPTVQEFVDAGYDPNNYPPTGYASKSTKDEVDAAIAKFKADTDAKAAAASQAGSGSTDASNGSTTAAAGDGSGSTTGIDPVTGKPIDATNETDPNAPVV